MKKLIDRAALRIRRVFQDESGVTVIEVVLILVVVIGLIVIFKSQLTDLIQSIFSKITSESAGI